MKINTKRKRANKTTGPDPADGSDRACARTGMVDVAADILVLLSFGSNVVQQSVAAFVLDEPFGLWLQ